MKNNSYFIFILMTIFVGVFSVSAMERKRSDALSEQMDMARAREEERRHRRERLADFERAVDRAYEQSKREDEQQKFLENIAEGAAL